MPNPFDAFDNTPAPEGYPTVTVGRRDPSKDAAERRDQTRTDIALRGEGREVDKTGFQQTTNLADAYNADPAVKSYRVAISQLGQALNTGEGPQADLALTYAFAKAMDPDSVVRESEQGMVTSSQPWFTSTVEKIKKQFGMDGAGNFTPEARDELRKQIINSVSQRQRIYDARRGYFEKQAQALGVDPVIVLGEHDKTPFLEDLQTYSDRVAKAAADKAAPPAADGEPGLTGSVTDTSPGTYQDSYLGQAMSGINEGLAGAVGAPVDLATLAINYPIKGFNALTNSNIPQVQNPVGGSDWFKDKMGGWSIYNTTSDPAKQFIRRAGESVGAAVAPAGFAGNLSRAGSGLLAGLGGGLGAATAQQVAPNNPLAEMLGEAVGGGLTGAGIARAAKQSAQRDIENAIPSIEDLKAQAANMYRQAEQRGVTADPAMTQQLADDFRQTLRNEGQLGPAGRITDADNNTTKAYNLIEQYAGQPMRPQEMNTIRGVIGDGRKSPDASDQRLAKILLDQFDDFVRPLAPEFDKARDISSRYLQAEDLKQAWDVAGANASQFTGSSFENALRNQYRALDRNTVKGREWFSPEVSNAIQDVSRGTMASNLARSVGRFAPTGPVPVLAGGGIGALAGGAVGGPGGGVAGGLLVSGVGQMGREIAENATSRAAQIAELTARNGGVVPQAKVPDAFKNYAAMLAAIEQAKYLNPRPEQQTTVK